MSPKLRLAALVLPLAGLAGAWGWTHVRAQQGTEWDVPVSASGPRASLRGRYLAFRYDWGLPPGANIDGAQALCLEGTPPRPAPVRILDPGAGGGSCRHVARGIEGGTRHSGLKGGLLYIPQDDVRDMRGKLADPKLEPVVRVRINDAGAITPLAITFRAK